MRRRLGARHRHRGGVDARIGRRWRRAAWCSASSTPSASARAARPAGPGPTWSGRGALLLTDLHVDLQPAGWRLVQRPGRDEQRAPGPARPRPGRAGGGRSRVRRALKLQAPGPGRWPPRLELPRGDRALSDPGAVFDLSESLADGLAAHVDAVRRRLPGVSEIYVQLDEPSLPAVLAGRVPTASGFGALAAVEEQAARVGLGRVLASVADAGAVPGVHCCAAGAPVPLFVAAGARFVSLDAACSGSTTTMRSASAVDAGVLLMLGLVASSARAGAGRPSPDGTGRIRRRWPLRSSRRWRCGGASASIRSGWRRWWR